MRTVYHERLADLARQLGDICGLAGVSMKRATQALLEGDTASAEEVIRNHQQIVAMRAHAEHEAFDLLALQQPVAGELRAVFGSIQIIADTERMDALAVHVAKIAQQLSSALPEEVRGCFADMAKVAIALGDSAKEVLVSRDPQKAARLREEDVAMDALYKQLFSVLVDQEWKHSAFDAAETALLGRFYERFADHAVDVGRHVIFMVTGVLPSEKEISTF